MSQGHAIDYITKRRRFAMSPEPHYRCFFPRNFQGPRSYGVTRKLSPIDLGYVKFTKGSLARVVGLGHPWTLSQLPIIYDTISCLTQPVSSQDLTRQNKQIASVNRNSSPIEFSQIQQRVSKKNQTNIRGKADPRPSVLIKPQPTRPPQTTPPAAALTRAQPQQPL